MRIWQLTPTSRPSLLSDVVGRFRKQKHADKKLCLVINGHWTNEQIARAEKSADVVIMSEPGKAAALQEGLAELSRVNARVVIRDDDDIYLPDGLCEFARLIRPGLVVAQQRHWLWDGADLWLLNSHLGNQYAKTPEGIYGGNVGLVAKEAAYLPIEDARPGQTQLLVEEMMGRGAELYLKSRHHVIVNRTRQDHTWTASSEMARFLSDGPALRCELSTDFVTGKVAPIGELVEKPDASTAHRTTMQLIMNGRNNP